MNLDIKNWFKQQLKLIEIEVFSFCNRKCWFCPNSYIDRINDITFMSDEMYFSIINQLKEINYDQEITYSRYNEPLSHKDVILSRLQQARQKLPDCKLRTNTNGDYIKDSNYIEELRDSGLNELFIQQYLSNNEKYNHKKMKEKMINKMEQLNVPYSVISDIDNQRIEYKIEIPGIKVHLRARNFSLEGTGRTEEVIKDNNNYIRTKPCKQPFNNMYIDYNGSVMVCCNTRSDVKEHSNGKTGNVNDDFLWNIYASKKYDIWRNSLKDVSPKTGICKTCKIDLTPEEFLN